MSVPQNFRTSFNGFNREDVVRYLEYINAKHASQVNQMSSELDYLRRQLEAQNSCNAEAEALRAQLEESLSIRKALEARCNGLQQELDDALAAAGAAEKNTASFCHVEQELEAYRRAERIERKARERAEQVYHSINGVLADATIQVDNAAEQLGAMADAISGHLEQLRSAVNSSRMTLKDAAHSIAAIRPEEE